VTLTFTKHTLANGLDVLLHEDRTCPIVAVNLWYHVGSKNERPGHTGFAHLFEHLMFEGSQHHDRGYFPPLQGAGATLNGSTNADRTNYWEVVPSNALELALWMESDRMGYLLPALTQAKFSNQRDVVLNERRQNYENRPYGLAPMALLSALFPDDHPYHWTTIGEVADLNAVRLDEVQAFFRRYYHPANASLALAGDIDMDDALAMARAYFEDLEPGERVDPVEASASLSSDVRIFFEDRVELPRLYMAWLTPAMFAPGDADLISGRICWPTARRRASTSGSCSTSGSRPTSRRRRTRARSPATRRSPPRRPRGTRSVSSRRPSPTKCSASPPSPH
jgi:zinc protease